MQDILKRRANKKTVIAYILLVITVFTILLGLYLIREQIQELAVYEQERISDDNKGDPNGFLYEVIIRMSFIIIIFFVCQVLLRLYRYNILKADHYLACADAFVLCKDLTMEQKQNFEALLISITTEKVSLIVPKSPTFPFMGTKDKVTKDGTKGKEDETK